MKLEPRVYKYKTNLKWTTEHKGEITSPEKPVIKVACPPEWGGHPGIWSPEDMFVGSLELCTMTTYLWLLDRHDLKIKSYVSSAEGVAKMVGSSFAFSEVNVEPRVEIFDTDKIKQFEELFEDAKRWCLITKTVKCDVNIKPTIIVVK